ncbi:g9447 [Coccomyxa elongata]
MENEGFAGDGTSDPSTTGPSHYYAKREANYNNWRRARGSLAQTAMAIQDPLHDPHLCAGCGTEAVVRCLTCSLVGEILCAEFLVPLGSIPVANPADTVGQGSSSPANEPLAAPIAYAVQDLCLLIDDKAPSVPCCCSEPCQWDEAQVGRSITCITSLGRIDGFALAQFKCLACGVIRMHTRNREEFRAPYYDDIFIRDGIVLRHIEALDLALSGQQACEDDRHCGRGYWKAARDRPNKYKDLHYSGRVVGACRHLIIQRAANIIQSGESYAYHHLLHSDYTFPKGVKLIFQDIMCKWWPWSLKTNAALRASTDQSSWVVPNAAAEAAAEPLVSAAHGKLHSWHCQVLHSPLWRKGAGLGADEDVEICFSTLSRLINTTKNMGPARSTETISEVASDLNLDRILQLPASLSRRHATAINKAIEAEAGYFALCQELLPDSQQHGSHAFMDEMHAEVTRVAKEHEKREPTELGLCTECFKSCKQATGIINNLPKYSRKCADLERQLVDRNSLPAEVSVSASTARVQESTAGLVGKVVDQYNICIAHGWSQRGPTEVENILRGDFPWIAGLGAGGAGGLSLKSKIKLCEAWNFLQRCREERLLLEKEMRSCFTFWTDKHEAMSLRITVLQNGIMPTSPDHFSAEVETCTYKVSDEAMAAMPSLRGGVIARLRRTRAVAEAQLQYCRTLFQAALGDVSATVHEGSQPPSAQQPTPAAIPAVNNSTGSVQPSLEGDAELQSRHHRPSTTSVLFAYLGPYQSLLAQVERPWLTCKIY